LRLVQQEHIVPFGIVKSSPRPRTFGAEFDVDETFPADCLNCNLNARNLEKDHGFVLRGVVFHAFSLKAKKSLSKVKLGMVAELLAGEA
jgi:hypothetical protein